MANTLSISEIRRRLRVLILGKEEAPDHFRSILAANVQHWGHEAVLLSAGMMSDPQAWQGIEGDILIYDMDAPLQHMVVWEYRDSGIASTTGADSIFLKPVWPQVRLIVVLSSRSVSRLSLEKMGATALLHKPFDMRDLERYLCVFQRLLFLKAGARETSAFAEQASLLPEGIEEAGTASPLTARILVADDHQDVTRAICQCLIEQENQRYHYEVREVYDGLALLEQCLIWRPHCVVTDLLMPWLNGYQVMRCLADLAVQPSPAFVVISALMQHENPVTRSYLKDRAVQYVDKPFDIENLLTVVERALA